MQEPTSARESIGMADHRGDDAQAPQRDRNGLAVLDREDCMQRLFEAAVGRVAFVLAGRPVVLPVNYVVVERKAVAFRTTQGSKLSTAEREWRTVAFEIDDYDPTSRTGWSVLVQGRMREVLDIIEKHQLDELSLQTWPDRVRHPHWIWISIDRISGRAIDRT